MYQHTLYRAKKDKSGVAAQFQVNEAVAFLKVARQVKDSANDTFSWSKKGEVPDAKKNVNIKLGLPDLGSILSVLNGNLKSVKLYHEFQPKEGEKVVTQITVSRYEKKTETPIVSLEYAGISFGVSRAGEKYGFIAGPSDAEVLVVLFKSAILSQCHVNFGE